MRRRSASTALTAASQISPASRSSLRRRRAARSARRRNSSLVGDEQACVGTPRRTWVGPGLSRRYQFTAPPQSNSVAAGTGMLARPFASPTQFARPTRQRPPRRATPTTASTRSDVRISLRTCRSMDAMRARRILDRSTIIFAPFALFLSGLTEGLPVSSVPVSPRRDRRPPAEAPARWDSSACGRTPDARTFDCHVSFETVRSRSPMSVKEPVPTDPSGRSWNSPSPGRRHPRRQDLRLRSPGLVASSYDDMSATEAAAVARDVLDGAHPCRRRTRPIVHRRGKRSPPSSAPVACKPRRSCQCRSHAAPLRFDRVEVRTGRGQGPRIVVKQS